MSINQTIGRVSHLKRRSFGAVVAVSTIAMCVAACGSSGGSQGASGGGTAHGSGPIAIGMTAPLTGSDAQPGQEFTAGAKYAIKVRNAKGGVHVDGKLRKVKLLTADTQAQASVGVTAAQKLISQDHVSMLMGDAFSSDVTLAEMNLASQYQIPIVSGEPVAQSISTTVAKNPEKYKYFWKGNWSSSAYADAISGTYKQIIQAGKFKPKAKRIAFLTENTEYGRTIAQLTSANFKKMGWTTTSNDTVALGATDFDSLMNKLKSENNDIIVTVFTSPDSGIAFTKTFYNFNMKSSLLAVFYPLTPAFQSSMMKTANGLLWVPLTFNLESHKVATFANNFKKATGSPADANSMEGFDDMNLMLNAIDKANSIEPSKINTALSKTSFDGIEGHFEFDLKDHTVKAGAKYIPVPVAQIQQGKNHAVYPQTVDGAVKYKPQSWVVAP